MSTSNIPSRTRFWCLQNGNTCWPILSDVYVCTFYERLSLHLATSGIVRRGGEHCRPSICPLLRLQLIDFSVAFRVLQFVHSAVCLTTCPWPLPKRVLHRGGSSASSFNFHRQRKFVKRDFKEELRKFSYF
jgi:hypothetical protein